MHGEAPLFKRCCLCIPLRRGLLFWGYLKLALSALLLYPITMFLVEFYGRFLHYRYFVIGVIHTYMFPVLIMDLVLNVTFVVAAHKKSIKLFRICFYYMMVVTVLYMLFWIVVFIYFLITILEYNYFLDMIFEIISMCAAAFTQIVLQVYVILLLRSELKKLKANCEFRFSNKEAEVECRLHMVHEAGTTDEQGTGHDVENRVDEQI